MGICFAQNFNENSNELNTRGVRNKNNNVDNKNICNHYYYCCCPLEKFIEENFEFEKETKINEISNIKNPEIFQNLPDINIYPNTEGNFNNPIKQIINPVGPYSEMYKSNILLGQKILIVMLYNVYDCYINQISYNNGKKTVKDAVSHFGIEITTVNNYEKAIAELTKSENGKCPYYACWVLNNDKIENQTKQFLEILIKFWKNGGAVVLFSDNSPFIVETNLFLSMINVDFKMDGDYGGEKEIFGDETGLLPRPGLFNRKKDLYKYKNIQRQALSHNFIRYMKV